MSDGNGRLSYSARSFESDPHLLQGPYVINMYAYYLCCCHTILQDGIKEKELLLQKMEEIFDLDLFQKLLHLLEMKKIKDFWNKMGNMRFESFVHGPPNAPTHNTLLRQTDIYTDVLCRAKSKICLLLSNLLEVYCQLDQQQKFVTAFLNTDLLYQLTTHISSKEFIPNISSSMLCFSCCCKCLADVIDLCHNDDNRSIGNWMDDSSLWKEIGISLSAFLTCLEKQDGRFLAISFPSVLSLIRTLLDGLKKKVRQEVFFGTDQPTLFESLCSMLLQFILLRKTGTFCSNEVTYLSLLYNIAECLSKILEISGDMDASAKSCYDDKIILSAMAELLEEFNTKRRKADKSKIIKAPSVHRALVAHEISATLLVLRAAALTKTGAAESESPDVVKFLLTKVWPVAFHAHRATAPRPNSSSRGEATNGEESMLEILLGVLCNLSAGDGPAKRSVACCVLPATDRGRTAVGGNYLPHHLEHFVDAGLGCDETRIRVADLSLKLLRSLAAPGSPARSALAVYSTFTRVTGVLKDLVKNTSLSRRRRHSGEWEVKVDGGLLFLVNATADFQGKIFTDWKVLFHFLDELLDKCLTLPPKIVEHTLLLMQNLALHATFKHTILSDSKALDFIFDRLRFGLPNNVGAELQIRKSAADAIWCLLCGSKKAVAIMRKPEKYDIIQEFLSQSDEDGLSAARNSIRSFFCVP
uniref:Uncharacterized protein n=1 Tax=Corethron hystrix TaxID=216773 RepID=A0A7S1BSH7_9STRA